MFKIDTSNFNEMAERKKFFSNVFKHFFYMILISCISCFLAIYIEIYYYTIWVILIIFFIILTLVLSIINNASLIAGREKFIFFKTISFLDGFLLSPLVLLAGVKIVISTFLITTILFLILYFVSTLINEEKANFLRDLALWIFLIYFLLFLASFILPLFGIIGNNYLFEFFIPFFLGIGFVAITIYDFKEISILSVELIDNKKDIKFVEKYCAYKLYISYIYFFRDILRILIYLYGKERND